MKLRLNKALLLAVMAVYAMSQPMYATTLDLYILTGQSNSLGAVKGSPAPDELLQRYSTDSSLNASGVCTDILMWNGNYNRSKGALYVPAEQMTWQVVAPQEPGGTVDVSAYGNLCMGPEYGFAYMMSKKGWGVDSQGNSIAVIKTSLDGGGNNYWEKTNSFYAQILATVQTALHALVERGTAGQYDSINIAGLLYLQGESNDTAQAAAAADKYTKFLSNLKADLQNAGYDEALTSKLTVSLDKGVAGEPATWANSASTKVSKVTAVNLRTLADGNAHIGFVTTQDLDKIASGDNHGVHYSGKSQITIGARYAYAMAKEQGKDVGFVRSQYYDFYDYTYDNGEIVAGTSVVSLNDAKAWWNGRVAGENDIIVWDVSSANQEDTLSGHLSVAGIRVEDPYRSEVVVKNIGESHATLGVGGSGIELQNGDLRLCTDLSLSAGQSWILADGRKLTVGEGISSASDASVALTLGNGATLDLGGSNGASLTLGSLTWGEGASIAMNLTDAGNCDSLVLADGSAVSGAGVLTFNLNVGNFSSRDTCTLVYNWQGEDNFSLSAAGFNGTLALVDGNLVLSSNRDGYAVGFPSEATRVDKAGMINIASESISGTGGYVLLNRQAGTGFVCAANTTTVDGDIYLKIDSGAEPNRGVNCGIFGAWTAVVNGAVYIELDAGSIAYNARYGSASDPRWGSISGLYRGGTVRDSLTIVIKDGTFHSYIAGGCTNAANATEQSSIGRGVFIEIDGGAFDGNSGVYGGSVEAKGNQTVGSVTINGGTHLLVKGGTFGSTVTAGNGQRADNSTIDGGAHIELRGGVFNGDIVVAGYSGSVNGGSELLIAGDGVSFGNSVGIYAGGAGAGILSGNATIMLRDITRDGGFSRFSGILSGGNRDGSAINGTSALVLDHYTADALQATLQNFTSVELRNQSSLALDSLGGAGSLTIGAGSSLTLRQGVYTGIRLGNAGTLVIGGVSDFLLSAGDSTPGRGGSYIVEDAGRFVLGEGYVGASSFTVNGGTLELQKGVVLGGDVTIAEGGTLALWGTFTNNGTLTLDGTMTIDSLANLDVAESSERTFHDRLAALASGDPDATQTANGYGNAIYNVFEGGGSIAGSNLTLSCSGLTYEVDANGQVRVGESNGRYFINEGTVVYGDTDNMAADDLTKVLILNGGTLEFRQDLKDGVIISMAQSSTVKIDRGVVVSQSQVSASDVSHENTLALAGDGIYDVGETWELAPSVALGTDADNVWTGVVRISGGGADINLNGSRLSTENSFIGLHGVTGNFATETQTCNFVLTNGAATSSGAEYALNLSAATGQTGFSGAITGDGNVLVTSSDNFRHVFSGDLSGWVGGYILLGDTQGADTGCVVLQGGADVAASFGVRNTGPAGNTLTVEVAGESGSRTLSGNFSYTEGNALHLTTTGGATKNFTGNVRVTDASIAGGSVTFSHVLQADNLTVDGGTVTLGSGSDATLGNVTVGGEGHLDFAAGANVTVNGTLDTATNIATSYRGGSSGLESSAPEITFVGGDKFVKKGSGALVLNGNISLSHTTVQGGILQIMVAGNANPDWGEVVLDGGEFSLYATTADTSGWNTVSQLTVGKDSTLSGEWWQAHVDVLSLDLGGNTLTVNDNHTYSNISVYRFGGGAAGTGTIEIKQAHDGGSRHTAVSLAGEETMKDVVLKYSTSASSSAVNAIAISADTVKVAGLSGGSDFGSRLNLISRADCVSSITASDGIVRTLAITGGGEYDFAGNVKGNLNLVMSGTGSQTFSGNVADFNGNITVKAGTLTLGGSFGGATFDASSQVDVEGGTLNMSGGKVGTLTVAGTVNQLANGLTLGNLASVKAGGVLNLQGGTLAGSGADIDLSGTLNQTAGTSALNTIAVNEGGTLNLQGGTLTVTNLDLHTGGALNLEGGTLSVNGILSLFADSKLDLGTGGTLALGADYILDLTGLEYTEGGGHSRSYNIFNELGGTLNGLANGSVDMSHLRVNGVAWRASYADGVITLTHTGTMLTWNDEGAHTMAWESGSTFTEGGDFANGYNVTFASNVTASVGSGVNAASLDVEEGVTLVLTGGNALAVGDINLEAGAMLDARAVSLGGVATVDLSGGSTMTVSNGVTGADSGAVTYTGSGTLQIAFDSDGSGTVGMSNASRFFGVVDVTAGTVDIGGSDISKGTWRLSGTANAVFSGNASNDHVLHGDGHTLSVASGTAALSGAVSGGGFTKAGAGTLKLSGSVDMASVDIAGGTLLLSSTDASTQKLGNVTLSGGTLAYYYAKVTSGEWSVLESLAVGSDTSTIIGGENGSHRARVDIQSLALNGHTLVLADYHKSNHTSVYRLSGADAGTGKVEVQQCDNGNNRHTSVSLAGEETLQHAVLNYSTSSSTDTDASITYNAVAISTNVVKLAGLDGGSGFGNSLFLISRAACESDSANIVNITSSDGTVRTLEITGTGEKTPHSFAGTVMDGLNLKMTGAGTQEFTGNVSHFNGSITMTAGTLAFTDGLATGNTVDLDGGTLRLGGNSSFSSLSGTGGTLAVTPANGTLSLTGEGATFSGTLQGVTSLTLADTATGTHTLGGKLGSLADYTVSGGTLAVASDVSTVNAVTVNKGAKLEFSGTVGSIATADVHTGGTLTFGGAVTEAGTASADGGTLSFGNSVGSITSASVRNGAELTFGGEVAEAGTVSADGGAITFERGIGTAQSIVANGGSVTFKGDVNHAGTIAVHTGGTVGFDQASGQISELTVDGGTLSLTQGASVGTLNLSGGEITGGGSTLTVSGDMAATGGTIVDTVLEYTGREDAELGAAMENSSLVVSGDGHLTLHSAAEMHLVDLTTNGDITMATDVSVSGTFSLSDGADITILKNHRLSYNDWNYIAELSGVEDGAATISKGSDGDVTVNNLRLRHSEGGTEAARDVMSYRLDDVRLVNADGHIELTNSDNKLQDLVISGGSVKLGGNAVVTGDVTMATPSARLLLGNDIVLAHGPVTITGQENTVIDNNVGNAALFAENARALIGNADVRISAEGAYTWGASLTGSSTLTTTGEVTLNNTEAHQIASLTVTSGSLMLSGSMSIGSETTSGNLRLGGDSTLYIRDGGELTTYMAGDGNNGKLVLAERSDMESAEVVSNGVDASFAGDNDGVSIRNVKATLSTGNNLAVTSLFESSELTVDGGGRVTLVNEGGHTLSALVIESGSLTVNGDVAIGSEAEAGVLRMNAGTSLELAAGKTLTDYLIGNGSRSELKLTGRSEEHNAVIVSAGDGAVFNVDNDKFSIKDAKVTVTASEDVTVASVLDHSEVAVLGNGTATFRVKDDGVNDFIATEGSVAIETSGTANVGKLTVSAGKEVAVGAGGEGGTLSLEGEATVTGGTVNADVLVRSGASMAVTADGGDSSVVGGNLTVAGGGTLSLDSAEAVSVGGLLTLHDNATLGIADVIALGDTAVVATAGTGISLSDKINLIDAGLSGASHLVLTKGSDAVQAAGLFSAGTREADAQPDTLLATRVANTVTGVEVDGSHVTLTTDLSQSYIDSLLAGNIFSLSLTLDDEFVSTIRREAGGVGSISVSLADLDVSGIDSLCLNGDYGFNAAQTGPAANIGGVFHSYDPMQIPEPATATLSLLALAALAARRRRQRIAAQG